MRLPSERLARDEALAALKAIGDKQRSLERGGSDEHPQIREDDHVDADEILLRFIADDAIAGAFDRIEKWYA